MGLRWVRTLGFTWDKVFLGLVLSHVSTVRSAYRELTLLATWVGSFGTWVCQKLPTHERWTCLETWMQALKNSSKNDQNFMLCDSSKGWWDRKLPIKNHGNFLSHQDLLLSRNMKFWPFIELFSHVISCDFHVTFKKIKGFSDFLGNFQDMFIISTQFSKISWGPSDFPG